MGAKSATKAGRSARDIRIRDWLLFMLTASSGAVDAISFLALSEVFTAFMTGNIAFLGMSIAGDISAPSMRAVLTSMTGFVTGVCLGTWMTTPSKQSATHAGKPPAHLVWPRHTTFALGISLLAHLCFVAKWFAIGGRPGESDTLLLLAIWAFAMGLQSVAVRRLDVSGVFTTAATATFIFLIGDVSSRPVPGEEARRLAGVLLSLFLGATAGALLFVHGPSYAPVLPFLVVGGVVAAAATAFGHDT